MSRFDRYVLSQLLVTFGFFSLILVAVYWINQAVLVFDRLIADGQSAGAVLAFTALTLPGVIGIVLPMSAFAAAVYVTNRLNSESELVVMQATGFSPFRLARPVLVFGLFVSVLTSALLHLLVPVAGYETARQQAELSNNVTARFLRPGEFLHPAEGVTFYIGELTPEGVLRNVFLTDARADDANTTYIAREAFLLAQDDGPKLVMLDGMAQNIDPSTQQLAITRFDDFAYDIGRLIETVGPPSVRARHLDTLTLLRAEPAVVAATNSTKAQFLWEAHNRFDQALLAIIAPLAGFATLLLGAFSRFGVWRQIVAAILLLIVVKMVDNSAAAYARANENSWPIVYSSVVIGVIAVWFMLTWAGRVRRDRSSRIQT